MKWRSWTAVGRRELSKISTLGRAASPVPPEPAAPHGRCKPAAALWALTMRTLSLGSSRARLSSSSTTSQFSSPHLAQRQRLRTHAAPHKHFGPVARASRVCGAHADPPSPQHRHPRSWGASTSGTYSLRKCCASSLVRKTLAPCVSADTRLTSLRQSPRLSASTLQRESTAMGQPCSLLCMQHPYSQLYLAEGCPGQEDKWPQRNRACQLQEMENMVWRKRAPGRWRNHLRRIQSNRSTPRSPFLPLSPTHQLPAGPRVAVAA